ALPGETQSPNVGAVRATWGDGGTRIVVDTGLMHGGNPWVPSASQVVDINQEQGSLPMSLILEITQQNGLVVRQPVDPNSAKIAAQPGDKIRILDAETGQPAGDLVARRVGNTLVVEQAGGATVELTEFFAPAAPGEGCELVLEDGEKTTTVSQATEPID